jgi:Ca2+-binding RTX toxin-like protein
MGANIINVKSVTLAVATTFTANGLSLTIAGSTGADTIQAGGGTQTITGKGGADTLIGGGGVDTFKDTVANLKLVTIQKFAAGDVIDLTNLKPSNTVATTATWANNILTLAQGAATVAITLQGAYNGTFTASADGAGGTVVRYAAPASAPQLAGLAQAMAGLGAARGASPVVPPMEAGSRLTPLAVSHG